jgi:hypothetical protein
MVNSDKQQISQKALKMMSFTLTDTQSLPALQLLQQPFIHQHRRLWIQYNQIEYVGKNKLSSVTVPTVHVFLERSVYSIIELNLVQM